MSSCFPNTIQLFSINKVVSFLEVNFYNNSLAFSFFSNPQQLYRPFQWSISFVDLLQKHYKFDSHLGQNCLHPLNNHLIVTVLQGPLVSSVIFTFLVSTFGGKRENPSLIMALEMSFCKNKSKNTEHRHALKHVGVVQTFQEFRRGTMRVGSCGI